MRPHGVVVTPPAFDDDLRFPQRVEDLAIEQLGDLAIAIAVIFLDQLNDVGRQPCLVVSTVRDLALRRAMLTECRGRHGARKSTALLEHARCRRGGARGSVVSPGCLLRHRTTQPGVLRFQVLQPLHLVALQPAELLTPTVIVTSLTPIERIASATFLPCDVSTST